MIRHIVALRFADPIGWAVKAAHYAELDALRGHLGGILDFRSFTNISPEAAVVHGFRDGFWFDFADAAARDAYLADPGHQRAGAGLVAACGVDGIQVIDVEM